MAVTSYSRKSESASEVPYEASRNVTSDDMTYNPTTSQRKKSTCSNRIFVWLTIVFFLTTVILLAVLLWKELRKVHGPQLPQLIQRQFPGYFRTPEEQRIIEEELEAINSLTEETIVNTTELGADVCNINCIPNHEFSPSSTLITTTESFREENTTSPPTTTLYPPNRRKRELDVTNFAKYHGCCISDQASFSSPSSTKNKDGEIRTLLQYESLRQYFPNANCRQASSCKGGQCHYEKTLYTAVVYKHGIAETNDADDLEIDWFYFNSCCKSVNT